MQLCGCVHTLVWVLWPRSIGSKFVLSAEAAMKTISRKKKESTTSGNIKISVDESYMPVIAQELNVFDSFYPEGHIAAAYKTEKQ